MEDRELRLKCAELAMHLAEVDEPLDSYLSRAETIWSWVIQTKVEPEPLVVPAPRTQIVSEVPEVLDNSLASRIREEVWGSVYCTCGHLSSMHMGAPRTCAGILGKDTCGCQLV